MVKKTRTIIFLVCLFLFVLIAPSAVFYSQGYRIDLENKKIRQTGGLFLKILPKQTEVYLDGKLNKKTDFFFGSILIENLLPKKYKVEVKKNGYHSWEKTLEIKEKEVTEAKNIVLFPRNINFNLLSSQVEQFWFSPDQRKIILLEEDKSSSPLSSSKQDSVLEEDISSSPRKQDSVLEEEKLGWALKLYNLDKNIKSHLIGETDIFAKEAQLVNLDFSEDSKKIHLEVNAEEQINPVKLPSARFNGVKYFTLEDLDRTKPLLSEIKPPSPTVKDVITEQQVGNDIYYLNNSGHLFKSKEKLTAEPFSIKQGIEYSLEIFQDFIFLVEESKLSSSSLSGDREQEGEEDKSSSSPFAIAREGDNLYKFNLDLKVFENFFEKINSLKISPDNKKLAYFSDYEIWVLFLSDKNDPPQEKAGEKLFLIRLSEKISDLFWVNSNYLIFISGNKIKISEIDNRDKLNIIDIFEIKKLPQEGDASEMFYNQFDKKLYLLDGNNLYGSDVLLP